MTTVVRQAVRPSGSRTSRRAAGDAAHAGRAEDDRGSPWWAVGTWIVTLIFFLPVAWMVLTSLHDEADAATNPPSVFAPITFDNYGDLFDRDVGPYLINSATASVVSTLLVLVLAVPAAYALSIKPVEKWTDVMFFFLSTKFLPLDRRAAADLPDRQVRSGCSTTSTRWSSSTPR